MNINGKIKAQYGDVTVTSVEACGLGTIYVFDRPILSSHVRVDGTVEIGGHLFDYVITEEINASIWVKQAIEKSDREIAKKIEDGK